MLIGILSDSHGRADRTRSAVRNLADQGADLFIHLGDMGSESVLDELIGHNTRIVFGNCDDDASLSRYAQVMGILVDHPMGVLHIAEKRIAFTHGHLPALLKQAITEQYDYVLHGHTHEVRDERLGGMRVINPGALCRANRYTAALLDPTADRLQIIDIV